MWIEFEYDVEYVEYVVEYEYDVGYVEYYRVNMM